MEMNENEIANLQQEEYDYQEVLEYKLNDGTYDKCYINGNTDLKVCDLSFVSEKSINKDFVKNTTNWLLNYFNFEKIRVNTDKNDKKLIAILQDLEYDDLGEDINNHNVINFEKLRTKIKEEEYYATSKKH